MSDSSKTVNVGIDAVRWIPTPASSSTGTKGLTCSELDSDESVLVVSDVKEDVALGEDEDMLEVGDILEKFELIGG